MERFQSNNGRRGAFLFLFAIIFSIGITTLSLSPISPISLMPRAFAADANVSAYATVTPCQNPLQPPPDSRSLLVVLLDRSGSLVAAPNPTDPQLYSSSVTRSLADLWPGKMAVVAFHTIIESGSEEVQLDTLGPFQVGGDLAQRTTLKNQIQTLPMPSLGTPTGPAMDKALEIIKNVNAPLSRVVLITDGSPGYHSSDASVNDPDGSKEEAHILNDLVPQFCANSVPVDTIGLETTPAASQFLQQVASSTNGTSKTVTDPRDLANAVLSLDAQWQRNRDFRPLQLQTDNTYHITVSALNSSLHIFVFRSNNSYHVTLKDPNGQTLNPVEDSTDQHYVLVALNLSSPVLTGDYTVTVQDSNGNIDTSALVYTFIDSQLQVQLLTPTATTQVAINQHIPIQVRLLTNQVPVQQLQGKANINALVTYVVDGQRRTQTVALQQQGQQNLFSGQILAPSRPEAMTIEVIANYEGVPAETDITTQIGCGLDAPCLVQQYLLPLLIGVPILVLLLVVLAIWIIWNRRNPAPCGTLRTPPAPRRLGRRNEDEDSADIPVSLAQVGASRPLQKRIFERSVLTSFEIQNHRAALGGFDFDPASFKLLFTGNCTVDIQVISGGPVVLDNGEDSTKLEDGERQRLRRGTAIIIGNRERATFS